MERKLLTRALVGACLGGGALALPITISSGADGSRTVIRVNEACGQATECFLATAYICSTFNKDWEGYKCTQGCKGDG